MGFFAHRSGHLGPQGLEFFFGLITPHALQRTGQYHRDARQWHFGGSQRLALWPSDTRVAQGLHHLAVVGLGKKSVDAVRHNRPHIGHLQERVFAGDHDRIELTKMPGQFFGGGFAHMADAQAENKAAQRGAFGFFQRFEQVHR